jgi:hypothetical protein
VTSATNQDNKKYQELVICDGSTGAIKFSTNLGGSISRPEQGIWLNGNTLAWLDHSHVLMLYNLEADSNLGLAGKQGRVQITRLSNFDGFGLVQLSSRTVAYLESRQAGFWPGIRPTPCRCFSRKSLVRTESDDTH